MTRYEIVASRQELGELGGRAIRSACLSRLCAVYQKIPVQLTLSIKEELLISLKQ